jgi:signal peptidase I
LQLTHPESQLEEQGNTNWKRFMLDLIETVGLALILFVVINTVSARVRVDGTSMMPTLHDGEFILVNKLAYHNSLPFRGDIIVFQSVTQKNVDLIKRVIGLPGDQIVVHDHKVSVNGRVLDEPYIAAAPDYAGEWTVPQGDLFVLGDNRNDSSDSHQWGYLPMPNVVGKSLLIYWPPPEWAMIDQVKIIVAGP